MDEREKEVAGVEEEQPLAAEEEPVQEEDEFIDFFEEEQEEAPEEPEEKLPENAERAFARKLRKEREKFEQEKQQLRQQYESQHQQPPPQVDYGAEPPPALPKDQLRKLSDELGLTEEAANAMFQQQWYLNQQRDQFNRQQQELARMKEQSSKAQIFQAIEEHRQNNPHLPPANESELETIRQNHYRKTGQNLSYAAAYEKLVAYRAWTGELQRSQQAKAAQDIAKKGKASVQAGGGKRTPRPSIESMPLDKFQQMVERAKRGDFTKS